MLKISFQILLTGKVNKISIRGNTAKDQTKANRLNIARQRQKERRQEIWLQRRIGAPTGPPKIVGIISLASDADPSFLLSQCINGADWHSKLSPYHVNASYTQLKAKIRYSIFVLLLSICIVIYIFVNFYHPPSTLETSTVICYQQTLRTFCPC